MCPSGVTQNFKVKENRKMWNLKEVKAMDIPFNTQKEGLNKLEKMVQVREEMKGCRWYDVWQEDCKNFADKLIEAGADEKDIAVIMGWRVEKECYCGILLHWQTG